jgi:transcriptional regulator with XRE-family HTH domain
MFGFVENAVKKRFQRRFVMKKQESLSSRLRRLRKARGLSMKEVAEALKISESTYREWEYGRAIQGEPYLKLSEVLATSVYELLGGDKIQATTIFYTLEEIEAGMKKLRVQLGSFL